MRILSEDDVLALKLDVKKLTRLFEKELTQAGNSTGLKSQVTLSNGNYFQALPASSDSADVATVKWASVQATDPDSPRIQAVCLVTNGATGRLRGLVSFTHLTALRTAIMSLVAFRTTRLRFAAPRIAFIGTGVQALAHLEVFRRQFECVGSVRWFNPNAASAAHFQQAVERILPGVPCAGEINVERLIQEADILVSSVPATSSAPHLDLSHLRLGAFASLPDLGRAWIPGSQGPGQVLMTDDLCQTKALYRAGKLTLSETFDWDLRLLLEQRPVWPDGRSYVFAFGGLGLCDALMAKHCLDAALIMGVGCDVAL